MAAVKNTQQLYQNAELLLEGFVNYSYKVKLKLYYFSNISIVWTKKWFSLSKSFLNQHSQIKQYFIVLWKRSWWLHIFSGLRIGHSFLNSYRLIIWQVTEILRMYGR